MLAKKIKDLNSRKKFYRLEYLKRIYKVLLLNLLTNKIHFKKKAVLILKFRKIQKKYTQISKVQIKSRCILSNRSHGILRKYSLSRIKMRELLQFGILPGYKKAVW
jgi:ribosomal protein S14